MTARISKTLENAIIAAYLEGNSSNKISKQLGCSRTTCLEVLKRNGVKTRTPNEAHYRVSPEHEQAMITAYLNGASSKVAAVEFGYAQQTCIDVLRRNGIKPRTSLEVSQKYSLDHEFFNSINSEEKAYWLGFLTADAGIVANEITLAIQIKDKDHLYKFASAIKSEHPIVNRENQKNGKVHPYAYIRICSKPLITGLSHLGIGERKSFNVDPCLQVPQGLLRHYWRGLVDGDGSIGYNKSNKNWSMSLCGTKSIVTGFREYLSLFVDSNAQVRKDKSIFVVCYTGNKLAAAIGKLLYTNATIYLDRKMKLIQDIVNQHSPT